MPTAVPPSGIWPTRGSGGADALDPLAHLGRVAAELLAQRHGHGVHQVRAAGLDDVVELACLGLERPGEALERGDQVVRQLVERGEVDGAREDVVRGLAHVDVVVGMDVLAGERGEHLVRVHVRGGARAGLEDVDRELVVELARGDLLGRGGDPLGLVGVEQPELGVHAGGSALDAARASGRRRRESARPETGKFAIALRVSMPHSSLSTARSAHAASIAK